MSYKVLGGTVAPVKIFVDDLANVESAALDQIRNTSKVPWIKEVAIMPDVHFGIGATVGSVILSQGAVSPAVVGVDIGCFTGDTEIYCIGGIRKIKDLVDETAVEQDLVVLAFDHASKLIVQAKATALKTRKGAALVEVKLDEGSFVCTPDHPVMLWDGSYKCASLLKKNDKLMSLADEGKEGYRYLEEVVPLTRKEDVYCLQVPEFNNFALACGVFVHNCGMAAVKTPYTINDFNDKKSKELRHSIERSVPVNHEGNRKISSRVEKAFEDLGRQSDLGLKYQKKALEQLGSLGGGNHFIEVCSDLEGQVWVMLHSGSRNVGKELAGLHIIKAKGLMGELVKHFGDFEIEKDLAGLLVGTPEYEAYLNDLHWCQHYAKANRDEMLLRVLKDLSYCMHGQDRGPKALTLLHVNCHHNYIENVEYEGRPALLTRKGAVSAKEGELAILPGSMGTKSFIVRGKGNPDSFCSCSHGAGRKMSRGAAKRTFTLEDFAKQTEGVECRKDSGVLDEIPGAYKKIEDVIEQQADLVEVVAQLKQFICVKG